MSALSSWSCIRILLLAAVASAAPARDWVLSPLGDDAGDGSVARPLKSIRRLLDPALDLLAPGDRLLLRAPAGAPPFREDELRLRLPLSLMAFPGEQPQIVCPLNLEDGVCIQIDPAASGSVLSGLDVSGGQLYTVFLQTDWEQTANPAGTGASHVRIEDCRLHDSGRDVIKVTPKSVDLSIRRSEIYNSGRIYAPGTPLAEQNAEGIDNVQGHRMHVADSHIHDIATNGIYFKGGAMDVVIERNRIERTGESGINVGFDTSPEFFDLDQNPQYFEAVRGIVRNNLVRETGLAGIGLYASREVLIAHNSLIDTARAGHAALYFGVTLQDFDPAAGRPPNLAPRLLNNLVLQGSAGGSGGDCLRIRFANELGGLSGLSGMPGSDYTLYSRPGGCRFFDQRPDSALDPDAGGTLALWRQASGADGGSLESSAPGVDAEGRLLPGSPAIDRGLLLAEVSDDRDAQPRRAPVDIGADERPADSGGGNPTAGPRLINGSFSGSWYDPARGGEGFVLEIGGSGANRSFIASWYTWREGQPLWLFGSAPLPAGATRIRVPLLSARGARFGRAFRATDVQFTTWGEAEFVFTGCNALAVDYTPAQPGGDEVPGSLRLERLLTGIEGLPCQ